MPSLGEEARLQGASYLESGIRFCSKYWHFSALVEKVWCGISAPPPLLFIVRTVLRVNKLAFISKQLSLKGEWAGPGEGMQRDAPGIGDTAAAPRQAGPQELCRLLNTCVHFTEHFPCSTKLIPYIFHFPLRKTWSSPYLSLVLSFCPLAGSDGDPSPPSASAHSLNCSGSFC